MRISPKIHTYVHIFVEMSKYYSPFLIYWVLCIFQIHSFQLRVLSIQKKWPRSELNGKKISEDEWNQFKKSIEENNDEWQAAISSKRLQFQTLKNSKAMSKLTDEAIVDEEDIDEIDKMLSVTTEKIHNDNKQNEELDDTHNDEKVQENEEKDEIAELLYNSFTSKESVITGSVVKYLKAKYDLLASNSTAGTALSMTSLLNEVKDKKVYDNLLIENIILFIAKTKSSASIISSFKTYYRLVIKDQLLSPSSSQFFIQLVNTCYVNNLEDTANVLANILLEDKQANSFDFFVGKLCLEIQRSSSASSLSPSTSSSSPLSPPSSSPSITELTSHLSESVSRNDHDTSVKEQGNERNQGKKRKMHPTKQSALPTSSSSVVGNELSSTDTARVQLISPSSYKVSPLSTTCHELLSTFYINMKQYSIQEINTVLRILGKTRQIQEIFNLFQHMKSLEIQPNEESYEFLSTALVVSVHEECQSSSMRDLPSIDMKRPEIVFAGRSNVGKSSLVNFLVNRKTLASTSPTPGHTTQFHFFSVNQDRKDLPSFRLVDVPGLGYAEAEGSTQDSWRSLLERYVSVREPLAAVMHLIDSRHKITPTDAQVNFFYKNLCYHSCDCFNMIV